MAETNSSWCWVRVLSVDSSGTIPTKLDEPYVPSTVKGNGARPPASKAYGATDGNGQAKAIWWLGDGQYSGNPKLSVVFDLGPAFTNESAARKWITEPEGTRWAQESANFFLLSARSEDSIPTVDPLTSVEVTPANEFPQEDWVSFFRYQHLIRPEQHLFEADLTADAPQDKAVAALVVPPDVPKLTLDPPIAPSEEERAQLVKLRAERPQRRFDVLRQAQSNLHAIQPILDVVNINLMNPPAPNALKLVDLIGSNITRAVFRLKRQFNRARPWRVWSEMLPMDEMARLPPDPRQRLYPGHPSYPSGHATMAYAWAGILAEKFPGSREKLLERARIVAENREVAGVHFPSDSEAGKSLGEKIAQLVVEADAAGKIKLDEIVALGIDAS